MKLAKERVKEKSKKTKIKFRDAVLEDIETFKKLLPIRFNMREMPAKELKKEYIEFFNSKAHKTISSAPIIPQNDPTVLFTTAGMHPLVPYLLGQEHPMGKRLVDVQKCIRTGDIDLVGDNSHLTFFEMLGNWSLNDYFKKEAIKYSFEFLTKVLGFSRDKIFVTVFEGDSDAPRDVETAKVWEELGIKKENIYFLSKEDNWWGPAGETGPCGPCTEMFIDTGKEKCSSDCKPGCRCGKYFEIWNDVFMEFNKQKAGSYKKMKIHNVDTGMGVERTIAMLQGKNSVYETEVFVPIILKLKELSKLKEITKEMRIIADHLKAATFILGDEIGAVPSNVGQGYVVRRLIRRAIVNAREINVKKFTPLISEIIIKIYKDDYPLLNTKREHILKELRLEEERFNLTLEQGLKEFEKIISKKKDNVITGEEAFLLFQSYGFPIELTLDLAKEKNLIVNKQEYEVKFKEHQELSRQHIGTFKSGLADNSETTTKLHTATHILAQALREILDKNIQQKGSNITPERLRFDFNFDRKMTNKEIKKVEDRVNEIISENLEVKREEMTVENAKKKGAQGVFENKYGEKVSVYFVGDFSKEICAGPHATNTSELGKFKILKEESSSAGVRRIKAVLE